MNDEPPPLVRADVAALEAAEQRSLIDDVKQLAEDGKTLVEAELAYQKTRAAVAGEGIRGVAMWGAVALSLMFFALMALVIGALLILSIVVGPLFATAIVVVALLTLGAIAGVVARSRWARTARALAGKARTS